MNEALSINDVMEVDSVKPAKEFKRIKAVEYTPEKEVKDEKTKERKRAKAANGDKLADTLMFIHASIAVTLNAPEFALEKEESSELAKSVIDVMKEYNLTVDSKTEALMSLISTAGLVYGKRYLMYKARVIAESTENEP